MRLTENELLRIGILTQYYPPEIGAPQNRLSDLAMRLADAGHAVVVLTAMPNYPTGRIQDGYGGLWCREQRSGVAVIRSFIYPTQSAGYVKRLGNYFSFVVSSVLVGYMFLPRCDVLLTESPPLFLGIAGYALSRLKRCRLIFNVSDVWPESAIHLGFVKPGSAIHRISLMLEAFLYKKSWVVSGQSKEIVGDILRRFPTVRTYHLSNGVDYDRFASDQVQRSNVLRDYAGNNCMVLYAGLHGLAQGLDQILGAAEILKAEGSCRFVLIGDGPEKRTLQELARQQQLSNVVFLPPRPAADMPAVVASADIILVTLKKYIPGAVPSKLYEAMASGKPIVLVADGEAAEIVRHFKAGIVTEPGNIRGIVKAVRILRDNPSMRRELGDNGQRAAKEHFDRAKIAGLFADYLESHLNA